MWLPVPGPPALRPSDPAPAVPLHGADRTVRAASLVRGVTPARPRRVTPARPRRVILVRPRRPGLAVDAAQISGVDQIGTARIAVPADGQA
jgi:hypothetical protein